MAWQKQVSVGGRDGPGIQQRKGDMSLPRALSVLVLILHLSYGPSTQWGRQFQADHLPGGNQKKRFCFQPPSPPTELCLPRSTCSSCSSDSPIIYNTALSTVCTHRGLPRSPWGKGCWRAARCAVCAGRSRSRAGILTVMLGAGLPLLGPYLPLAPRERNLPHSCPFLSGRA